ncbi:hypothetical protein KMW28_19275 [Flammeovirga yaeyamensis]|uniref:PKD domain-containing protein n=1 Tax=Flammeovirga yaeyamensis TaxID=367791 RepID=A0AAX1N2S0_9BACT|nr:hypothetical protein [Flammeovirga yaeyamensis]MBB3700764.1 hypothetical protein [Flammeovirga yaeyamensis]NMF37880.1 hypothetical protein [Flammeovirga yaeyamensis]QWG01759.1 hypothetical protein KMW28_19275 [Flammeovirga yaeyamensis]
MKLKLLIRFTLVLGMMVFYGCRDNTDFTNPESPGEPLVTLFEAEKTGGTSVNFKFEGENIHLFKVLTGDFNAAGDEIAFESMDNERTYTYGNLGWGNHDIEPRLVAYGPRRADTTSVDLNFIIGEPTPEGVDITIGEPTAAGIVEFDLKGRNVWKYTFDFGDGNTDELINTNLAEQLTHRYGYSSEGTFDVKVVAHAAVESVEVTGTVVVTGFVHQIEFYADWGDDKTGNDFNSPFTIDKQVIKDQEGNYPGTWDKVFETADGNGTTSGYSNYQSRQISSYGIPTHTPGDDGTSRMTCGKDATEYYMAFRLYGNKVLEASGGYLDLTNQSEFRILAYADVANEQTTELGPHEVHCVLQSRGNNFARERDIEGVRDNEIVITKYINSNDSWEDLSFDFSDDSDEWVNADGSSTKPSERKDLDTVIIRFNRPGNATGDVNHRLFFDRFELLKSDGSSNFGSRP